MEVTGAEEVGESGCGGGEEGGGAADLECMHGAAAERSQLVSGADDRADLASRGRARRGWEKNRLVTDGSGRGGEEGIEEAGEEMGMTGGE